MAITNAQQYKQLLAQGGRTGFRMGSDEGNVSGRQYDAPSTRASAPPSQGFGNPPPSTSGGGDGNQPPSKKFTTTATDVLKEAAPYVIGGPFGVLSRSDKVKKAFNLFNLFKGLKDVNIFTPVGAAEMTPEEKEQLLKDAGIEAGATTPPAETFPSHDQGKYSSTIDSVAAGPPIMSL